MKVFFETKIMILDRYYKQESSNSVSKFILKDNKIRSKKGLFLDRDGVLIEDVHHIKSPKQVKLTKDIGKFLKEAKTKGYEIIVVTNQSSVSRSIITFEEYKDITEKFLSLIPYDAYPNLILSSFHLPKNENQLKNYNWRKPGTGMINYALNLQKYDKSKCGLIGDKLTDLIAGNKAGIPKNCYIKSELHKDEAISVRNWFLKNNIPYKELDKLEDFFI